MAGHDPGRPARPEPGSRPALTRWLAGLADFSRRLADRIDHRGAPKLSHISFTFEEGLGLVFRDDGCGCRLAWLGDDEYERAHTEAGRPEPGTVHLAHRVHMGEPWPPPGYQPVSGQPNPLSWPASGGSGAALRAMLRYPPGTGG